MRPALPPFIAAGLGIAQAIASSGLAATLGRDVQVLGYSTGFGIAGGMYIATVLVAELQTSATALGFVMP